MAGDRRGIGGRGVRARGEREKECVKCGDGGRGENRMGPSSTALDRPHALPPATASLLLSSPSSSAPRGLDQELDDGLVEPIAREEERRLAFRVPRVDVRAPVEEEADDGQVAPLAREEERRLAFRVPRVDVGAPVEEEADDGQVAPLAREEERRAALPVPRVNVGANAGADMNTRDGADDTVLDWALEAGDAASVGRLLALGARLDAREYSDYVAMHRACAAGHIELVRLLLDERDNDGGERTYLNHTDGNEGWAPLHHAELNGRADVTEVLVAAGADIDVKSEDGDTVLDWAVANSDEASVRRLVALGARLDAPDDFRVRGVTVALHRASEAGNVAMVELLLELGARVDTPDARGWSALLIAEHNGHADVTEVLVAAGADVDWRDEEGDTTALDWALDEGDEGSVRRLVALGARLDAPDDYDYGMTVALHRASQAGNVAMVELLLELGAKVDARDGSGRTALLVAGLWGHLSVVRLLLDRGADVRAGLPVGWTPLHLASQNGDAAVVRLLIDRGADVGERDGEGKTALLLASQGGHEAVVQLLVDAARR
jgi:uncharacterized protein